MELAPKQTPIARPGDWKGFTLGVDAILRQHLPEALNLPHVRARLIAHSSLAVGWNTDPQRCWHHNAWGVRRGNWKGDWYRKSGPERINGKTVILPASKSTWRAYPSWAEAVFDLVELLASSRYLPAAPLLLDPAAPDEAWWSRMGELGWYTAEHEEAGEVFADRARIVRGFLGLPQPETGASTVWTLAIVAGLAVLVLLLVAVTR